jgi:hypothetical protein
VVDAPIVIIATAEVAEVVETGVPVGRDHFVSKAGFALTPNKG